jgi:transglutaminase-like putative cysteine protease
MQIRIGYDIAFDCPQPTPMLVMLRVHDERAADIIRPDYMTTEPPVPVSVYRDMFGNQVIRLVAPPGRFRLMADGLVQDSGLPEAEPHWAEQHAVQDLPPEVLRYLLGSRYCDTDRLSEEAWRLFGHGPIGWARVKAVCDFVHQHLRFDYQLARATRTAWEAYQERVGVCRDFAHLALTLCRCLNIPARYCTGYLGDIGVPLDPNPMDFSGWFEVFLGGQWFTCDARHNHPRIGRIVIARGLDAADVAITNTFGPNTLAGFTVWTDEVAGS